MTHLGNLALVLTIYICASCCLVHGQTKQNRRENFADVFNFILDLKTQSGNNKEFITKMQAVFCPSQPICGTVDGQTLERSDVIDLNQELTIGNKTEELDNLASLLGICCPPCSCSISCKIKGNCCPSLEHLNSSNNESDLNFSCVQPSSLSYFSKPETLTHGMGSLYFMVNQCFDDRSNESIVEKCESPTIYNMDEIIPVTSVDTGYTYWNSYCASCNSDQDMLSPWRAYVFFKQPPRFYTDYYLYPTTVEKLQRAASKSLIYRPPFAMDDNVCLSRAVARGCDEPLELFSNENMFLLQLCNAYYSPISTGFTGARRVYRNIFCFICDSFRTFELQKYVETAKCYEDETKHFDTDMTALLDFANPDTKSIQQTLNEQGYPNRHSERCDCNEVYDTVKDECRPLYCPVGEFMNKCQCQQPMKIFSGMPIQLVLKISPESQPISDQLSQPVSDIAGIDLRQLHLAIKKCLNKVVHNVTIAILATFKLETFLKDQQYLITAVRTSSKFGHDTKRTMKPFLRYRDTGNKLKIRIKKAPFSIEITGRARIWLDPRAGSYRCTDYSAENATSTLLYLDENVHPQNQNAYQVLSPLMYCFQVQLEIGEFEENDGVVTINSTSSPLTIYDFYRLSKEIQAPIRICADIYFPKINAAQFWAQKFTDGVLFVLFWSLH